MMNIVFLILQFISLLAFGMLWYMILKWSPEECLCMSVLVILSIVFLGGFFSVGLGALAVIYVLSSAGGLLFLFGGRIGRHTSLRHRLQDFFTPGVVLLTIVFLFGAVAFNGLVLVNWDELHQWGKAVNYMLHYNVLPSGESFDGESVLLSSTTLFHYYFCKFPKVCTGEIIESNMYVSNLVLWYTAVILPLSGMKWKEWRSCFAYGAIVFLSMNIMFVQPYFNIYCDQPVAMWAGAVLTWNIFCKRKRGYGIFNILAIMQISMMKNMMGPLFAAIVVLALFIKWLLELEIENGIPGFCAVIRGTVTLKKTAYAGISVCSIFLLTGIWSLHIRENALRRGGGIIQMENNRFGLTIKSGIEKWFQPVNLSTDFPNMTFFLFLLITVCLGYYLAHRCLAGKLKTQYAVLLGLYAAGFLGFFCVMIYAYLTTFSYDDSIITGSLNRYFSDYILLGVIPLIIPAVYENKNNPSNSHGKIVLMLLLIVVGMSTSNGFWRKSSFWGYENSSTYEERMAFNDYRDRIISMMDDDRKIYMINQNLDGYYTVVADYVFEHLIDRERMCYYFTSEKEPIPGLSRVSMYALPEILLQDYGYLWIYHTDEHFNNNAFRILKIKTPVDGDFYKVENRSGRLKLKYLGNSMDGLDGVE